MRVSKPFGMEPRVERRQLHVGWHLGCNEGVLHLFQILVDHVDASELPVVRDERLELVVLCLLPCFLSSFPHAAGGLLTFLLCVTQGGGLRCKEAVECGG